VRYGSGIHWSSIARQCGFSERNGFVCCLRCNGKDRGVGEGASEVHHCRGRGRARLLGRDGQDDGKDRVGERAGLEYTELVVEKDNARFALQVLLRKAWFQVVLVTPRRRTSGR
jgi:hypothetical protein